MPKKYFVFLVLAILIFANLPKAVFAQSATLYFSPASGTFTQGESFWVDIMVNTKGEKVNAVAAYLDYAQDKLEALGVNTAGSVMTFWAEKIATAGEIKISGGLPTPGFSGIQKIASIGFKVKASSGSVNLKFRSDSAVMTDIGNKNILSLVASGLGTYSFGAPSGSATPAPGPQALVISNLKADQITRNSAVISWQTNQDSDSVLDYGITTDYLLSNSSSTLVKNHSLAVSGLLPGSLYYFKVKSQTASGARAETQDSTFTTLGYLTEIQILDPKTKEPLPGLAVTTGGVNPQTQTTNNEGKVFFENLSEGRQNIVVEGEKNSFTYQIKVAGKSEPQNFEIIFDKQPISISLLTAIAFSVVFLALAIFLLITLLKPKGRQEIGNNSQL